MPSIYPLTPKLLFFRKHENMKILRSIKGAAPNSLSAIGNLIAGLCNSSYDSDSN